VGSFGSGKTVTNLHKAIQNRLRVPKQKYIVQFVEPYTKLLDIAAYPTLYEVLPLYGLEIGKNCTFKGNPKVLNIPHYGEIHFGSLDNAEKIMGSNTASFHIDECDRVPEEVMNSAFRQVFGRFRVANADKKYFKNMSRLNFSSTPEGFKFLYKHFHHDVIGDKHPERKLVTADVWSNPFIDVESFVANFEHLPDELRRAYLNAEFVNMESGSVYNYFKRDKHVVNDHINYHDNMDIYIGCDFNIQNMAAVIAVKDEHNNLFIFDEIAGAYDTFELINSIKAKYNIKRAVIYPDASGRNRHTSSNTSNTDLLHGAGFKSVVYEDSGNPRIRDTINLINTQLKGNNIKFTSNCTNVIAALEQQTYNKKGEPDKTQGIDHIIDSLRYLCYGVYSNSNNVFTGFKVWGA